MATSWFNRNGVNDPIVPSNYTITGGTPSCIGTNQICAIFATVAAGNLPVIDEDLKDDMIHALDSRSSNATVKLKA